MSRLFQIGALKAMLDEAEVPLNHVKPHGQWVCLSYHQHVSCSPAVHLYAK
jgi:lactam utilization protein B